MIEGQRDGTTSVDGVYRPPSRQEQLRRLLRMQRAADELAIAQLLERRADCVTPVLASLLRERAGERRDRAARLSSGPPWDLGPGSRRQPGTGT